MGEQHCVTVLSVSMDAAKKTENWTNPRTVNGPPGKCLRVNENSRGSTTMAVVRLPW